MVIVYYQYVILNIGILNELTSAKNIIQKDFKQCNGQSIVEHVALGEDQKWEALLQELSSKSRVSHNSKDCSFRASK